MLFAHGRAKVIYRPIGERGLEGFDLDDTVNYQYIKAQANYYRIWKDDWPKGYHVTCSERAFNKYFMIIE